MNMNVTGHFRSMVILVGVAAAMLGGQYLKAEAPAPDSATKFPPLEGWKSAVVAGDAGALKALYSTDPAAHVMANGVVTSVDADVTFWLGLKARSTQWETVAVIERPWGMSVVFKAEVQLPNDQTLSVTDGQGWKKRGEQWQLISVERADAPHLKQPSDMKKNIYPADAAAHAEIKKAGERAAAGHKH